jgi:hypothetical protein
MQMTEFVRLRSKCYAYTVDGREIKKDNGIKKVVVKKHLPFKDYRDVLYSHIPQYRTQTVLRSQRQDTFFRKAKSTTFCIIC